MMMIIMMVMIYDDVMVMVMVVVVGIVVVVKAVMTMIVTVMVVLMMVMAIVKVILMMIMMMVIMMFMFMICLFSVTDTPDLRNKDLVSEMQTKISKCLSDYEDKFHPQKANRYGKLLLCLSTLRSDSEKALESYITLELFGKLDIPPLVAELLD